MMVPLQRRATSAYDVGTPSSRRPSVWSLLPRTFLLLCPAQLLGAFIGGKVLLSNKALLLTPHAGLLVSLFAGLLAGMAVGILLQSETISRRAQMILTVVTGTVLTVALNAYALLRASRMTVLPPDAWTTGLLLVVIVTIGVQSLVASGIWTLKDRLN